MTPNRRVLAYLAPWLTLALAACSGSDGQEGPPVPAPAPVDGPASAQVDVAPNSERAPEPAPAVEPPQPRVQRPIPPVLRVTTWVNTAPLGPEAFAGKVVVLDFWSTASGGCRRLMPRLQALLWKHEAKGLALIGVSEDPVAEVREFANAQGIAYPLAVDAPEKDREAMFDVWRVEAVPTVWVLDRYGEVAWRGRGEDLSEALLLEELAKAGPSAEEAP